MAPRQQLVDWLNAIVWRKQKQITPEAQSLVDRHLEKIRPVVKAVMAAQECDAVEAHAFAQTAGHNTPEGESIIDDLFDKVVFLVELFGMGHTASGEDDPSGMG